MNVDITGQKPVASVIESSGLSHFLILKEGSARGTPVFEFSDGAKNRDAINAFNSWANNMLSGNPRHCIAYEMICFDGKLDDTDEEPAPADGQDPDKPKAKKKNKIRFSFALNNSEIAAINGSHEGKYLTKDELQGAIQSALQQKENEELKKRVEALEAQINDDDFDDDDENDTLGTVERIIEKISNMKDGTATPKTQIAAINGAERNIEQKKQAIQQAIKILYSKDSDLDIHLTKLAKLAQEDMITFKLILSKLNNL